MKLINKQSNKTPINSLPFLCTLPYVRKYACYQKIKKISIFVVSQYLGRWRVSAQKKKDDQVVDHEIVKAQKKEESKCRVREPGNLKLGWLMILLLVYFWTYAYYLIMWIYLSVYKI